MSFLKNFERLITVTMLILIFFTIALAVRAYMNQDYALVIAKKMIAKYDIDHNNQLSVKEFQNMLVIESLTYRQSHFNF
jgi:hypothetical protein